MTIRTKPRLSSNSANLRSSVGVSGPLLRPKMKAKTATMMNNSRGTATGAVTRSRCRPVTMPSSQTKTAAPRAKSRKVGVRPMSKGSVAKGSRATTPMTAKKPNSKLRSISTAASPPKATAAAAIGPPKPSTTPASAAVRPSSRPSVSGD